VSSKIAIDQAQRSQTTTTYTPFTTSSCLQPEEGASKATSAMFLENETNALHQILLIKNNIGLVTLWCGVIGSLEWEDQ
jgi:hypothetical protein